MKRLFFASLIFAMPVWADGGSAVVPVGSRMLGDDGRAGVRMRRFLVVPQIDFAQAYNSNIYAMRAHRKSDYVSTARPQVTAQSNWSRHALNVLLKGEFNRFAVHDKENTDNYTAAVDGRLDVLRQTALGGGLSWVRAHEDRGDPNSPATALHPTQYDTTTGKLGLWRNLGRFNARVDGEIKNIDYKNDLTRGGLLVNNNLRDRTDYAQALRLGYQAYPGYEIYTAGTFDNRVYDIKAPLNRNSRGDSVVAGVSHDLSGKTKADAFAGYTHRNYGVGLRDIITPVYGMGLTWNVTDASSVIARISRSIEETTLAGSTAYVLSDYGLDYQHAFTRRLLGTLGAELASYQYKGFGPQRRDDLGIGRLGLRYSLNRLFSLGADYTFTTRDSNAADGDYVQHVAMLRLTGRF
jgi:hypothetical protein